MYYALALLLIVASTACEAPARERAHVGSLADIRNCYNTVKQFGDAIVGSDYESAFQLTSEQYRQQTTLDEFVSAEKQLRAQTRSPKAWALTAPAEGSVRNQIAIGFGSGQAGAVVNADYSISATFAESNEGCTLNELRFNRVYRKKPDDSFDFRNEY